MLLLSILYAATTIILGLMVVAQKEELGLAESDYAALSANVRLLIRTSIQLALQGFRPIRGGNSYQRRLARRAYARAQKLGNA